MTEQMRFSLAEQVVKKLMEKGWTISFAESCSGGMACARLVDVPDASKVLNASFVTYANEAKMGLLGVQNATLEQWGAVSEQTAGEMALGVAKANKATVGVAISGIAGPGGGTAEKPVGTVCFGFAVNGRLTTETKHFGPLGRTEVRNAATDYVFATLFDLLS